MNRIRFTSCLLALAALLALAGPLTAAPPRYVFQDLGVLPNCGVSSVSAVNNLGQVAGDGIQAYPLPSYFRAFLKNYGQPMQDLGTLGGNYAWAAGINNTGQVTGCSEVDASLLNDHAFLKNPGQPMVNLGTLGGDESRAYGINDAGQVVGYALDNLGNVRPFLKSPGQAMEDLGGLGDNPYGGARGINSAGQVVGQSWKLVESPEGWLVRANERAFLKSPGQPMENLGTLGGDFSSAYAINQAGQVVGWAQNDAGIYLAYVKNPGEAMQALQTPAPYTGSQAWSINRRGQIAGSVSLSGAPWSHAALWDQGIMYNLNDLTVNLPFPGALHYATGINDQGWITVDTGYSSGAGLLIPGGDPSTAIQLLLLD
ncbi:MAG: hypothetical protein Q8L00_11630 [Deltaproteobacteria bacterium]|nr:hypothetical protein [Deltaproteobacteria bacterium]